MKTKNTVRPAMIAMIGWMEAASSRTASSGKTTPA